MSTLRELLLAVSSHALAKANGAPLPDLPDGATDDKNRGYDVELLENDYVVTKVNARGDAVVLIYGYGKLVIGDEAVTLVDRDHDDLIGTFDDDGTYIVIEAKGGDTIADSDGDDGA